jgi:hypothetical protein
MQQNVQDLFVPLEIALKLKKKGYDDKCIAVFIRDGEIEHANETDGYKFYLTTDFVSRNHRRNSISAPTFGQAENWLLRKFEISTDDFCLKFKKQMIDCREIIMQYIND